MERLTERDEYGNADIVGVESADFQLSLDFDEMNIVTDVLNRLAAYEETGLMPDEVGAKKNEIILKDQEIDRLNRHLDNVLKLQEKQIESLQRELNAEISVNDALTADKDEQAGRIMRMEDELKRAKDALEWLNIQGGLGYTKHSVIGVRIKAIDALLGGKEDV